MGGLRRLSVLIDEEKMLKGVFGFMFCGWSEEKCYRVMCKYN